jgi:Asp-tRNA(Asn)/Glu-tRNA(Gln) amidotransferase A subunit family amidase
LPCYDTAARCRVRFDQIAREFAAVLTLSAPGEAPRARTQRDNTLNRDWMLLHVPCINIPVGLGPNRMPIGLTLTGPRYSDRRLLAVAAAIAAMTVTPVPADPDPVVEAVEGSKGAVRRAAHHVGGALPPWNRPKVRASPMPVRSTPNPAATQCSVERRSKFPTRNK